MSTARQTLELAEDLKAHLTYPQVHTYMGNVAAGIRAAHDHLGTSIDENDFAGSPQSRLLVGEEIARRMTTALTMGEMFYLTEEMRPVVQYASGQLEGTEQFAADLFPAPFGLIVFEQGRISVDRRGKKVVVKALLWGRESFGRGLGTMIYALSDMDDERDETLTETLAAQAGIKDFVRGLGRLHLLHLVFLPDGMRVGPQGIVSDLLDEYGQPYVADNEERFLMSFLLMLRQTITTTRVEQVSPKMVRHLARRHLPHQVTVVLLRRIEGVHRAEGESQIEWSCRWITRGHWRNARVSSVYPGAVLEDGVWRARVWIAPYVKGPSDAPFKETVVVNALTR